MPVAADHITERARAKLNLDLLICGRRSDGKHELDSLVVFCELGDLLHFEPARELSLAIEGPFAAATAADETNLVLRAGQLLARTCGIRHGAAIRLIKNLPVAAGLGGGSADAAATLRGLRALWDVELDDESLRELGLQLGADVPVCLFSRPARMRGIGERLDPVRGLPDLPLLLVNPGRPVATAAVFARVQLPDQPTLRPPLRGCDGPRSCAQWLAQSRNDLEPAACALLPEIATVLDELRGLSGCLLARMSGSGATCFGLFSDRGEAEAAAATLRKRRPNWWIAPTVALGDPR